jgi:hypothetical protein
MRHIGLFCKVAMPDGKLSQRYGVPIMRKLILIALISGVFAVPAFAGAHGGQGNMGRGNMGMSNDFGRDNSGVDNDAHGDAVSAVARLARTENDGDTVGADVSAVAKDNSHGHGKSHVKGHNKTHPG